MTTELDFEFNSRFEEDENIIKERMLESDTLQEYRREPGDFVYDVVAPLAPEIQQHQANLDEVLRQSYTLFAEGEYLDYKVAEAGLTRADAQPAIGQLVITATQGVTIPAGQQLSNIILDEEDNPIMATVQGGTKVVPASGTLTLDIQTNGTGDIMNLSAGGSWIFSPPIAGVKTITQPTTLFGGTDQESDEVLRGRWQEKRQKPVRSGNKQSYISWALEVNGVGKAKALPLWNGRGTVKVIIADTEGQPATPALILATQNYIDPTQDGMGEGRAPVGAIVTVASIKNRAINLAAKLTLTPGSTLADATEILDMEFAAYLDELAKNVLDSESSNQIVIVYNKVAALLIMNEHISDYTGLTVNSGTANITLALDEIPTKGTLTLT